MKNNKTACCQIMDNENQLNESHSINNAGIVVRIIFVNKWKALNLINSIDFMKYK